METAERVFYTSDGDVWALVRSDEGEIQVMHRPNAASGGESRTMRLGPFLLDEPHSAQNQALHTLLATLITLEPAASDEELDG